jgi:hypothetical protein
LEQGATQEAPLTILIAVAFFFRTLDDEVAHLDDVHIPAVEDRYVLLAIQYMIIYVQSAAVGGLYIV